MDETAWIDLTGVHRAGVPRGIPGPTALLIWQRNKQTTVIPAEAGIFWQTPTVLEAIPASAGMTRMGYLIARVINICASAFNRL